MMLKGQNTLVVQYLRALPKDECAETRANLIKSLENIQKSRSEWADATQVSSTPAPPAGQGSSLVPDEEKEKTKKSRGSSSRTKDSSSGRRSRHGDKDEKGGSLGRSSGSHVASSPGKPEERKNRFRSSKSATDLDSDRSVSPEGPSGTSSGSSPSSTPNGSGTYGPSNRDLLLGAYRRDEEIGKGMFGVVHRATNVHTGILVAIKAINIEQIDPSKLPNIMREADVLRKLDHPNIVKMLDVYKSKKRIYFVLEYLDSGSLFRLIKRCGPFPEPVIALHLREILYGLEYIHSQGIVHRDIKASNILLSHDGAVKLVDFGTAKPEDTNRNFTVVGTPYWMAPEIIQMEGGGISSDIWSLGCTIIELLTGVPPYFELTTMQALFNIVEDRYPPIPETCTGSLRNLLIHGCFVKDPRRRRSATELLQHPLILGLKDTKLPNYETLIKTIKESHPNGPKLDKNSRSSRGSSSNEREQRAASAKAALNSLVTVTETNVGKDQETSSKRDSKVVSPRVAVLSTSSDSTPRRKSSADKQEISELQHQIKKLTKEKEQYKKENDELKKQLEIAQSELACLKAQM